MDNIECFGFSRDQVHPPSHRSYASRKSLLKYIVQFILRYIIYLEAVMMLVLLPRLSFTLFKVVPKTSSESYLHVFLRLH